MVLLTNIVNGSSENSSIHDDGRMFNIVSLLDRGATLFSPLSVIDFNEMPWGAQQEQDEEQKDDYMKEHSKKTHDDEENHKERMRRSTYLPITRPTLNRI